MDLKEIGKAAYDNCVRVGFRGPGITPPTKLEHHALIHSEVAEATEAVRNRELPFYIHGHPHENEMEPQLTDLFKHDDAVAICANGHKPEGEATELADAVIRIAETAFAEGWDLEAVIKAKLAYNSTRPHRHGGKTL